MGAYYGLVTDISGRISCSCATDWSPVDGVMLSQIHRHATDAQQFEGKTWTFDSWSENIGRHCWLE